MPPKPPPPDDDTAQRKSTAGHVERLGTPGIPSRFVPPRPVSDEVTPPEPAVVMRREREAGRLVPPVARPRVREQTLVGMGPVTETPTPKAPVATAPPRSLSPSPDSIPAVDILTPIGRVSLRKKALRTAWIWAGPVVLSALGTVGGYLKGYLWGLAAAHDDIVKIRSAQQRDHDKLTELEQAEGEDAKSLAAETQSNRAERATRDRNYLQLVQDFEAFKKAVPAIQGLPPKR
jgi:hypothetical protein